MVIGAANMEVDLSFALYNLQITQKFHFNFQPRILVQ